MADRDHEHEVLFDVEKQSLLVDSMGTSKDIVTGAQRSANEETRENVQVYKSCRACYIINICYTIVITGCVMMGLYLFLSNFFWWSILDPAR